MFYAFCISSSRSPHRARSRRLWRPHAHRHRPLSPPVAAACGSDGDHVVATADLGFAQARNDDPETRARGVPARRRWPGGPGVLRRLHPPRLRQLTQRSIRRRSPRAPASHRARKRSHDPRRARDSPARLSVSGSPLPGHQPASSPRLSSRWTGDRRRTAHGDARTIRGAAGWSSPSGTSGVRRRLLLLTAPVLGTFAAVTGVTLVVAFTASVCPAIAGGTGDQPSADARREIPAQLLPIYVQVGAQYGIPWEVLAGIGTEECSQARISDPSCTLQPGATGPGVANFAGASGLMQIGIGGAAGDEYDTLRRYLPNPSLGPHDPLTAVTLAALVLTKDKGARTGQPIDSYRDLRPRLQRQRSRCRCLCEPRARRRPPLPRHRHRPPSVGVAGGATCGAAAVNAAGYVNPFAHAQVSPSRVDQGVDYGGSGPIDAFGPGRVALVSTTDTRLGQRRRLGVLPAHRRRLRRQLHLRRGRNHAERQRQDNGSRRARPIGRFNGHSIEIGFALGQGDLALAHSVYTEGADTAAGRAMNQLLASLRAPAGHRDATSCGGPCPVVGGPVPNHR